MPTWNRWDSLRQSMRAMELVRIWEGEYYRRAHCDAGIACMPRERVDRTRRAGDYLFRRVMRHQERHQ